MDSTELEKVTSEVYGVVENDNIKITAQLHPFKSELTFEDIPRMSYNDILSRYKIQWDISDVIFIDNDTIVQKKEYDNEPTSNSVYLKAIPAAGDTGTGAGLTALGALGAVAGVAAIIASGGIAGVAGGIVAGVGYLSIGLGSVALGAGLTVLTGLDGSTRDSLQLPHLRGTGNSVPQNTYVPVIFGEHLFYPDVIGQPYTSIDADNNQYLHVLFCNGYINTFIYEENDVAGDYAIYLDDKPYTVYHTADDTNKIDVDITGTTYYPKRVVEETVATRVEYSLSDGTSGELVYTTPTDTKEIEVTIAFPSGLCFYNNNYITAEDVDFSIEYKKVGADDSTYQLIPINPDVGLPETSTTNVAFISKSILAIDNEDLYNNLPDFTQVSNERDVYIFTSGDIPGGEITLRLCKGNTGTAPGGYVVTYAVVEGTPPSYSSTAFSANYRKFNNDVTASVSQYRITGRTNNTIRRSFKITLDNNLAGDPDYVATRQYVVRVRRLTLDSTSTNRVDEIFFDNLKSYIGTFDDSGAPDTWIINSSVEPRLSYFSMKVKASTELKDSIGKVNCTLRSKAVKWDSARTGADGSSSGGFDLLAPYDYTGYQNPATAFLTALTDENIFPQHYVPLADVLDKIDLVAIEEFYRFCEDPNGDASLKFTFNFVLSQESSMGELLSKITTAGRSSWGVIDGKFTVIIDKERTSTIQYFTPRNSWGFSAERLFSDTVDAIECEFIDENSKWAKTTSIIYYNDASPTRDNSISASFEGVTNNDQISHLSKYLMNSTEVRRESISFSADAEAIVCTRGDLIGINHDILLAGIVSGRIKTIQNNIPVGKTTITLDEVVTFEDNVTTYGVVIRNYDGTVSRQVENPSTGGVVDTDTIIINELGLSIDSSDLFMFGEYGTEVRSLLITNIEYGNDATATITGVDYNSSVYTVDTPATWNSNMTIPGYLQRRDNSEDRIDRLINLNARVSSELTDVQETRTALEVEEYHQLIKMLGSNPKFNIIGDYVWYINQDTSINGFPTLYYKQIYNDGQFQTDQSPGTAFAIEFSPIDFVVSEDKLYMVVNAVKAGATDYLGNPITTAEIEYGEIAEIDLEGAYAGKFKQRIGTAYQVSQLELSADLTKLYFKGLTSTSTTYGIQEYDIATTSETNVLNSHIDSFCVWNIDQFIVAYPTSNMVLYDTTGPTSTNVTQQVGINPRKFDDTFFLYIGGLSNKIFSSTIETDSDGLVTFDQASEFDIDVQTGNVLYSTLENSIEIALTDRGLKFLKLKAAPDGITFFADCVAGEQKITVNTGYLSLLNTYLSEETFLYNTGEIQYLENLTYITEIIGKDIYINTTIQETGTAIQFNGKNDEIAAVIGTYTLPESIQALQLAAESVTTRTLAEYAVRERNIDTNSITARTIADLTITSPKIALNAIETANIASNAVTSDLISNSAIITEKIADDAVTFNKVANIHADQVKTGILTSDARTKGDGTVVTFTTTLQPNSTTIQTTTTIVDQINIGDYVESVNGDDNISQPNQTPPQFNYVYSKGTDTFELRYPTMNGIVRNNFGIKVIGNSYATTQVNLDTGDILISEDDNTVAFRYSRNGFTIQKNDGTEVELNLAMQGNSYFGGDAIFDGTVTSQALKTTNFQGSYLYSNDYWNGSAIVTASEVYSIPQDGSKVPMTWFNFDTGETQYLKDDGSIFLQTDPNGGLGSGVYANLNFILQGDGYIGGDVTFDGTLTAETVDAIEINAAQITTGQIVAGQIAVGAITDDKVTSISGDKISTGSIQSNVVDDVVGNSVTYLGLDDGFFQILNKSDGSVFWQTTPNADLEVSGVGSDLSFIIQGKGYIGGDVTFAGNIDASSVTLSGTLTAVSVQGNQIFSDSYWNGSSTVSAGGTAYTPNGTNAIPNTWLDLDNGKLQVLKNNSADIFFAFDPAGGLSSGSETNLHYYFDGDGYFGGNALFAGTLASSVEISAPQITSGVISSDRITSASIASGVITGDKIEAGLIQSTAFAGGKHLTEWYLGVNSGSTDTYFVLRDSGGSEQIWFQSNGGAGGVTGAVGWFGGDVVFAGDILDGANKRIAISPYTYIYDAVNLNSVTLSGNVLLRGACTVSSNLTLSSISSLTFAAGATLSTTGSVYTINMNSKPLFGNAVIVTGVSISNSIRVDSVVSRNVGGGASFIYCTYLTACRVDNSNSSAASTYGFYECDYISCCEAKYCYCADPTSPTSTNGTGFYNCNHISSSISENNDSYGFYDGGFITGCRATNNGRSVLISTEPDVYAHYGGGFISVFAISSFYAGSNFGFGVASCQGISSGTATLTVSGLDYNSNSNRDINSTW